MKKKSLTINALLSAGQRLLSIVFPLITFPYISRVLLVEDIGKINFTSSIISYFILISGLGIANYATREGAKIRDKKEELDKFCSEMFSINIISTVAAYAMLFIIMFFSDKLKVYTILLIVQSFSIIGTTVGVNWIYAIEEDYLYITVRTLLVQFVSLILMLMLVRDSSDYITYAVITVLSNVGANLFNYFYAKKYTKIHFIYKFADLKRHIKPVLIIFASSIAITIYVESDTTLLGLLCGEYSVGLYSRSAKIYTIIKQMVTAMVIVALPNLSKEIALNDLNRYIKKAKSILYNVLLLAFPIGIGLAVTAKDIMLIAAGQNYVEASASLSILGISIIFAVLSSYLTYCCLLPMKFEKIQMIATLVSALMNICLNFYFLPLWAQTGAAMTTLISEIIVFGIEFAFVLYQKSFRSIFDINFKHLCGLITGIIWIIGVKLLISNFQMTVILDFGLTVVVSAVGYFLIMKFYGYPVIDEFINKIASKLNISVKN